MMLELVLNGKAVQIASPPDEFLLEIVRRLGCLSVKEGCGDGECGACTVLVDGAPARSCILFAWSRRGSSVTTVEGLTPAGRLSRVQQALADAGGVQCGFCTPGLVVAIEALLAANPRPSEAEIRQALSGNLCRCTGYLPIVQALLGLQERSEP